MKLKILKIPTPFSKSEETLVISKTSKTEKTKSKVAKSFYNGG